MKFEMLRTDDAYKFREELNEFIKYKKIIDIKFDQKLLTTKTIFDNQASLLLTAFITYED